MYLKCFFGVRVNRSIVPYRQILYILALHKNGNQEGFFMYKIFIVEDDEVIAGIMRKHILSWGFDAVCAEDFSRVLETFQDYAPHLVLMDVKLPFYNGFHWCAQIRKISRVPILFISSASDNMNMIMAMNMGGDDFIAKPFDLTILIAKVQAMLRRSYDYSEPSPSFCHRGATLNLSDATLHYKEQTLELTKNDYRILLTLMETPGKIVSRETLMEKLWQTDSYVDENTLSVNITRLRKKLDALGLVDFITTKKGMGYIIE